MKKTSMFYYSYTNLNNPADMSEKSKSEMFEKSQRRENSSKRVRLKAPEHLCNIILDYANAVCK